MADETILPVVEIKVPEGAVENDDGSVTLQLEYAVTYGSEDISEITLSRPKAKHLEKIDGAPQNMGFKDILKLIGELSAQPPNVVRQLDAVDIQALSEIIAYFFEKRRRTGKASSAT